MKILANSTFVDAHLAIVDDRWYIFPSLIPPFPKFVLQNFSRYFSIPSTIPNLAARKWTTLVQNEDSGKFHVRIRAPRHRWPPMVHFSESKTLHNDHVLGRIFGLRNLWRQWSTMLSCVDNMNVDFARVLTLTKPYFFGPNISTANINSCIRTFQFYSQAFDSVWQYKNPYSNTSVNQATN